MPPVFSLVPRAITSVGAHLSWRSVVKLYRSLFRTLRVGSLVPLIIPGCGGGSGFDPNNVTVTVSPAAVTIPASSQVTLQAMVKGTGSSDSALTWSIAEQTINCYWLDTPPAGPCPDGTIQQEAIGSSSTVTYHAPGTSGTFHVTAEWSLLGPSVIKHGTSVVTVGP